MYLEAGLGFSEICHLNVQHCIASAASGNFQLHYTTFLSLLPASLPYFSFPLSPPGNFAEMYETLSLTQDKNKVTMK